MGCSDLYCLLHRALTLLVVRSVGSLRPHQRSGRADLIAWLREYRNAGVFPHNDGFADNATPIFRDRSGVLCAMAFLIARSGREDIVDRIAHTNNLALISDVEQDSGLVSWLDSVGLSLAEASRIQPNYQPPAGTVFKKDAITPTYAIASILVSGTAIGTAFLNIADATKPRAWAGLMSGAGAIALGLGNLDGSSAATPQVALVDMVVGSAALVVGLRSLRKSSHSRLALADHGGTISVIPAILNTGSKPQLGIGVHIGF